MADFNGTKAEFEADVAKIQGTPGYRKPEKFGVCIVAFGDAARTEIIDCNFLIINDKASPGSAAIFQKAAGLIGAEGPDAFVELDTKMVYKLGDGFHFLLDDDRGHENVIVTNRLIRQTGRLSFHLAVVYDSSGEPSSHLPVRRMVEEVGRKRRTQSAEQRAKGLTITT